MARGPTTAPRELYAAKWWTAPHSATRRRTNGPPLRHPPWLPAPNLARSCASPSATTDESPISLRVSAPGARNGQAGRTKYLPLTHPPRVLAPPAARARAACRRPRGARHERARDGAAIRAGAAGVIPGRRRASRVSSVSLRRRPDPALRPEGRRVAASVAARDHRSGSAFDLAWRGPRRRSRANRGERR